MILHVIILGFLAAAYLALGLWIHAKYQRSAAIQSFVGFLLGLAALSLASLLYQLSSEPSILFRIAQFGYLSGVFTFSMMLVFSWNYPIPSTSSPKNQTLFWIVPLVFFLPLLFLSDGFLKAVEVVGAQRREVAGSLYWLFPVMVTTYFIWALINFFRKLKFLEGKQLRAMRVFVWAFVASAFVGVAFDVVLPAIRGVRGPYGIELSLALVGISSYIAFKK